MTRMKRLWRLVFPDPAETVRFVARLHDLALWGTLVLATVLATLAPLLGGWWSAGVPVLGAVALAMSWLAQGLLDRSPWARRVDLLLLAALVGVGLSIPFADPTRKDLQKVVAAALVALWGLVQLFRRDVRALFVVGGHPDARRDRLEASTVAWTALFLVCCLGAAWSRVLFVPPEWRPTLRSAWTFPHIVGCAVAAGAVVWTARRALRPRVVRELAADAPDLLERAKAVRAQGRARLAIAKVLEREGYPCPDGRSWTGTAVKALLGPDGDGE
jgi:hypothetical protein